MRIMIAEDDKAIRMRFEKTLSGWDFMAEAVTDGQAAWNRICNDNLTRGCIIEWADGTEFFRRVREKFSGEYFYLIILSGIDNLIEGLNADTADYVIKPFIGCEPRSRIDAGVRVIGLERMLADKVLQLEAALKVRQLKGLLPFCSYCNKTRNKEDSWEQVENYIARRSDVEFSHSIYPVYYDKHVQLALNIQQGVKFDRST